MRDILVEPVAEDDPNREAISLRQGDRLLKGILDSITGEEWANPDGVRRRLTIPPGMTRQSVKYSLTVAVKNRGLKLVQWSHPTDERLLYVELRRLAPPPPDVPLRRSPR